MSTDIQAVGGPEEATLISGGVNFTWSSKTPVGTINLLIATEDPVSSGDRVYFVELPGPRYVGVPESILTSDMFRCKLGT